MSEIASKQIFADRTFPLHCVCERELFQLWFWLGRHALQTNFFVCLCVFNTIETSERPLNYTCIHINDKKHKLKYLF